MSTIGSTPSRFSRSRIVMANVECDFIRMGGKDRIGDAAKTVIAKA